MSSAKLVFLLTQALTAERGFFMSSAFASFGKSICGKREVYVSKLPKEMDNHGMPNETTAWIGMR